jgi:cytochrome c oxidase subunit IV
MSTTVPEHHTQDHAHPGVRKYIQIAIILAIVTSIEVAVYYIPPLEPVLVPVLLALSALKFWYVVAYYMHLKFDHRLFTWFFVFGLAIAGAVILSFLALFQRLWW